MVSRYVRAAQHSELFWRGGQAVSPYEQNTQQSPGLGVNSSPQAAQSWNHAQALVGIVCNLLTPQCGQVRVEVSCGVCMLVSARVRGSAEVMQRMRATH